MNEHHVVLRTWQRQKNGQKIRRCRSLLGRVVTFPIRTIDVSRRNFTLITIGAKRIKRVILTRLPLNLLVGTYWKNNWSRPLFFKLMHLSSTWSVNLQKIDYRGFERQPCCMAGAIKVFCTRKNICSHRKKNLLFLPCKT